MKGELRHVFVVSARVASMPYASYVLLEREVIQ